MKREEHIRAEFTLLFEVIAAYYHNPEDVILDLLVENETLWANPPPRKEAPKLRLITQDSD